jgi:hypothetical protein
MQDFIGVHPKKQTFLHQGVILQDHLTLEAYGLKSLSEVDLFIV